MKTVAGVARRRSLVQNRGDGFTKLTIVLGQQTQLELEPDGVPTTSGEPARISPDHAANNAQAPPPRPPKRDDV